MVCIFGINTTLIHQNQNHSATELFPYLISCCDAEVFNLVQTLPTTDDNYNIIWSKLSASIIFILLSFVILTFLCCFVHLNFFASMVMKHLDYPQLCFDNLYIPYRCTFKSIHSAHMIHFLLQIIEIIDNIGI